MNRSESQNVKGQPMVCPFLQPAQADWIYPVAGYCRGLPQGLLMIPTVDEYRTLCSTEGHRACPIYRHHRGEDSLEAWLRTHYRPWNSPLAVEEDQVTAAQRAGSQDLGSRT